DHPPLALVPTHAPRAMFSAQGVGSKLRADYPQQGVKIACRFTRIWAYISDKVGGDSAELVALGGEADRLVEEFNAGLHAHRPRQAILQALADAGILTSALLALDPIAARNPYYAHERRIIDLLKDAVGARGDGTN
ncbi:hypothetical protein, partial [Hyphomicrobium sp. NDB2Meth4]|uniref:hypothetical protein n=1 Tax=Hyphomicrobium sp. NDB2Meth4 TaxID=1892846 RepID=UPI000AE5866C